MSIDTPLVIVLFLNFYILVTTQLRAVVYAVALQGIVLSLAYPLAHTGDGPHSAFEPAMLRMWALVAVMIMVKGWIIPRMLLRAIREADIRRQVESSIGIAPTLLIGALGTTLAMAFARTLPLEAEHTSHLVVPASLATALTGFLILTTRWRALTQVLGYIVLENGIFIFGLLLINAIPVMVEIGVLLDLFVGVFVMGIIINHVSRAFPSATSEHLSSLREESWRSG